MANNRIGRNVEKTTCEGEYYDANNKKWPFKVSVWGTYDVVKLTRKLRNILKTDRFLINPDTITHESFWASMPLDKFVEVADVQPHKKSKED